MGFMRIANNFLWSMTKNILAVITPPEMPGYDQLSECKDLPDPLAWSNGEGKVTHFNEWALSPFIDKFLLGKKNDTNNIQINVFDQ
jgi:hypothetical protein